LVQYPEDHSLGARESVTHVRQEIADVFQAAVLRAHRGSTRTMPSGVATTRGSPFSVHERNTPWKLAPSCAMPLGTAMVSITWLPAGPAPTRNSPAAANTPASP